MSQKLKLSMGILLFLGWSNLQAQEAVSATGGEATGSGGTVNYTVGQPAYSVKTGSNGNYIIEGVQQPYEISVVTSIPQAKGISLDITAYPNPTTNYLVLKVKDYRVERLQYQVFDMNGRLLKTVQATGTETMIGMSDFAAAGYFIKVLDVKDKKMVKQFKIFKR